MVVNGRPLKRGKRRITADLCDFLTFPSEETLLSIGEGPFRSRMPVFLSRHASLAPPPSILAGSGALSPAASNHLLTWRMAFRVGEAAAVATTEPAVELDIVEEDVPRSKSVYCDHCRVVGWSGHPVCGKRYHFIIRNKRSPAYKHTCTRCGTLLDATTIRCSSCNNEIDEHDLEDWAYLKLHDASHLLHGVVHTNGYGHLLRVNGREGGSKFISGSDIMSFWDRLCKMLAVRKVTVMDVSKKHGMEYRVLHAICTGHAWYGCWGYQFGAGCFGVTAEAYQDAVQTLSSIPLSALFTHTRLARTQLQNVIDMYSSISDHPLLTIRDLFCFLTQLLRQSSGKNHSKVSVIGKGDSVQNMDCAWASNDVDQADKLIIKVLRAVSANQWVPYRALRQACCRTVGSLDLLDYCLKNLAGKVADDGLVVAARCNTESHSMEYRLQILMTPQVKSIPSYDHLCVDLRFLYHALLDPMTMDAYKVQSTRTSAMAAARKLLDCKQFVKHYDNLEGKTSSLNPFAVHVWCNLELADQPNDLVIPPELIVLPLTATLGDLKVEATKAFQETYLIFQRIQAVQLLDYGGISNNTQVKLLLGHKGTCRIKLRCYGDERRLGQYRSERGLEQWTVDCSCGAKDDDGERMLACDACGIWQHTRCAGIEDTNEVPAKFLCKLCTINKRPVNSVNIRQGPNTSKGGAKIWQRRPQQIEANLGV